MRREGLKGMGGKRVALAGLLTALLCAGMARPQQQEPLNPSLKERSPETPTPKTPVIAPEGKMRLDVVVTDAAGQPVTGLEPWDFSILDNDKPRKILTFHGYDGVNVKADPPVEVILVFDEANLPFQQVAFVRDQMDAFLRKDDGHLKQPVTLVVVKDTEMRVQPQPSLDGNAVANLVNGIKGNISTINSATGGEGLVERFQRSVHSMATIAENEATRPGRKLLIWIGPGWPMLDLHTDGDQTRNQKRNFDGIVELSTRLREGRMVVYSVAPGDSSVNSGRLTTLYQAFLKGVTTETQATAGNLALKVLVTQTGGGIFGPDNDLAGQIERCVGDANVFYRISFDPPLAAHADEYHSLRVVVNKPGVTVRTNTGYYDEPPNH
jgi:VWFA-related protein